MIFKVVSVAVTVEQRKQFNNYEMKQKWKKFKTSIPLRPIKKKNHFNSIVVPVAYSTVFFFS